MLRVMLCGASDTVQIRNDFTRVVEGVGGEALHYLSGDILYVNAGTAQWARNSRATVNAAEICVFVVLERYGEITWGPELGEVLNSGKPFLVLCLESTYNKYLALTRSVAGFDAISDGNERQLVIALRELESERELTIVTFDYGHFDQVFRRQLSRLFEQSLALLELRNKRASLAALLGHPTKMSRRDLALAAEVAVDEFEDKLLRRRAIHALAERGGADEETVAALIASPEQGVQRLAIQLLEALYTVRPPSAEFLSQCVSIANGTDDVGVTRRLIPVLVRIDLAAALRAFDELDLKEIGIKRRLALELERYEPEVRRQQLSELALGLARRCADLHSDGDWRWRLSELINRLSTPTTEGD